MENLIRIVTDTNGETFTETLKFTEIQNLKKGDFFRLKNGKEVYQAEGYCRYNKKYCGTAQTDINKQTYKKKGSFVEFDFYY